MKSDVDILLVKWRLAGVFILYYRCIYLGNSNGSQLDYKTRCTRRIDGNYMIPELGDTATPKAVISFSRLHLLFWRSG
jgi:hypothetical protein